jgi:hypothetical protein
MLYGKSYRPYYPDEDLLLPPSLREWMPEDYLAYFVSDVIDQLTIPKLASVKAETVRSDFTFMVRIEHPVHLLPLVTGPVGLLGFCDAGWRQWSARNHRQCGPSSAVSARMEMNVETVALPLGILPALRTPSRFMRWRAETRSHWFSDAVVEAANAKRELIRFRANARDERQTRVGDCGGGAGIWTE